MKITKLALVLLSLALAPPAFAQSQPLLSFAYASAGCTKQASLYGDGTGKFFTSSSRFFGAVDATASNFQTGTISYGTNSVVITWAKTGSPTGTFTESIRCFR